MKQINIRKLIVTKSINNLVLKIQLFYYFKKSLGIGIQFDNYYTLKTILI